MNERINQLRIKEIQSRGADIRFDFYVDDISLAKRLGINRIKDMRFSDFDLDLFEVDKLKFPNYERQNIVNRAVRIFLGKEKPFNQFNTNRIVLYRCHCGSDYCGVVSFQIGFVNNYVYWKNIQFEEGSVSVPENRQLGIRVNL